MPTHMGSYSVTSYPTEVRIPPLLPVEAGTRFSDSGGMQAELTVIAVVTMTKLLFLFGPL